MGIGSENQGEVLSVKDSSSVREIAICKGVPLTVLGSGDA